MTSIAPSPVITLISDPRARPRLPFPPRSQGKVGRGIDCRIESGNREEQQRPHAEWSGDGISPLQRSGWASADVSICQEFG
jgi:hypothetical protein